MGKQDVIKDICEASLKDININEAIKNIFPFWGQKRIAFNIFAEEIKKSNLSPGAKMFTIANAKKIFLEMQNQESIADIAYSALMSRRGENFTLPPVADYELLARLMDSGKFVSDENIQMLWGNILAGELDEPGHTPKNIVRILSELDKRQAEIFSNLCSLQIDCFCDTGNQISSINTYPMIPDDIENNNYLRQMKITQDSLLELDEIGLINYDTSLYVGYPQPELSFPRVYFVSEYCVITALNVNRELPEGCVTLTKAGKCISQFTKRKYNPQHMDALKSYLLRIGFEVSESPMVHIKTTTKEGICTVDI